MVPYVICLLCMLLILMPLSQGRNLKPIHTRGFYIQLSNLILWVTFCWNLLCCSVFRTLNLVTFLFLLSLIYFLFSLSSFAKFSFFCVFLSSNPGIPGHALVGFCLFLPALLQCFNFWSLWFLPLCFLLSFFFYFSCFQKTHLKISS